VARLKVTVEEGLLRLRIILEKLLELADSGEAH
jgi:hypothetical protein